MKAGFFFIRPAAMVLCLLALALPARALDRLWLQDGRRLEGEIEPADGGVKIRLVLDRGEAETVYPAAAIAKIELARTPAQEQMTRQGTGDAAAWRAFWEARRPYLSLSGSDSGEAGLGLADALLQAGRAPEAAPVAAQVAAADWNGARRERAEAFGLEIALGGDLHADEATAAAAQAFLSRPPADAAARSEAYFVLGRIAALRWSAWEAAHPGEAWRRVPGQAGLRAALLDEALADYLRAPVLAPLDSRLAARGLLEAARLAAAAGEVETARAELGDLIAAFPDPRYLASARTLQARLDGGRSLAATP